MLGSYYKLQFHINGQTVVVDNFLRLPKTSASATGYCNVPSIHQRNIVSRTIHSSADLSGLSMLER
jgi:hypothetical protein